MLASRRVSLHDWIRMLHASDRPLLRLLPNRGRRLRAGAPWVFSNEIAMRPEYRKL